MKRGDGINAAVLNGVLAPFISSTSTKCKKPSSAPLPSSAEAKQYA